MSNLVMCMFLLVEDMGLILLLSLAYGREVSVLVMIPQCTTTSPNIRRLFRFHDAASTMPYWEPPHSKCCSGARRAHNPFKEALDKDKIASQNHLEVSNLRTLFQKYEHPLKARGLLSPFSLNNKKCQGLHAAHQRIVGKVVYLT